MSEPPADPRSAVLTLWVDAQLSPALAPWINAHIEGVEATSVRRLGLQRAEDPAIFAAAREVGAVVMSKDADFLVLLERYGPPPQVIWVTLGNTSNARMRAVLSRTLRPALDLLRQGESLVEIRGA